VARREDEGAPRARDGETQRVADPARGDLVVAREAGEDRQPGGVGARPPAGTQAVRAQVEDRARARPPAPARALRREQLEQPAGAALDHQHVAVATAFDAR
jgi:hypothetical protein